jgi:hypothetical protein
MHCMQNIGDNARPLPTRRKAAQTYAQGCNFTILSYHVLVGGVVCIVVRSWAHDRSDDLAGILYEAARRMQL